MKERLRPLLREYKGQKVKSEFGFDTAAAISRSVAKRMFELLTFIFS